MLGAIDLPAPTFTLSKAFQTTDPTRLRSSAVCFCERMDQNLHRTDHSLISRDTICPALTLSAPVRPLPVHVNAHHPHTLCLAVLFGVFHGFVSYLLRVRIAHMSVGVETTCPLLRVTRAVNQHSLYIFGIPVLPMY